MFCLWLSQVSQHSLMSLVSFFPRAGLHLQNWDPNPYVFTCLLPSGPPASCSTVLAPFFLGYFEVTSSNAVSSYKAPQVYYLFLCIKIRLIYRPSIAGKLSFCPFFTEFSFLSISVPSRVQKHETHRFAWIHLRGHCSSSGGKHSLCLHIDKIK